MDSKALVVAPKYAVASPNLVTGRDQDAQLMVIIQHYDFLGLVALEVGLYEIEYISFFRRVDRRSLNKRAASKLHLKYAPVEG